VTVLLILIAQTKKKEEEEKEEKFCRANKVKKIGFIQVKFEMIHLSRNE